MIGAGMYLRLLLVLNQGKLKTNNDYVIFKCGYYCKQDFKFFMMNLHQIYCKQWIPQQDYVYDQLLIDQIDDLMKEWKHSDEYSKRISNEVMHDEYSYKHLQNIKSTIKKKMHFVFKFFIPEKKTNLHKNLNTKWFL